MPSSDGDQPSARTPSAPDPVPPLPTGTSPSTWIDVHHVQPLVLGLAGPAWLRPVTTEHRRGPPDTPLTLVTGWPAISEGDMHDALLCRVALPSLLLPEGTACLSRGPCLDAPYSPKGARMSRASRWTMFAPPCSSWGCRRSHCLSWSAGPAGFCHPNPAIRSVNIHNVTDCGGLAAGLPACPAAQGGSGTGRCCRAPRGRHTVVSNARHRCRSP